MTIRRGGAATSYRIVGEDGADSPKGVLSWNMPLAGVLTGVRAGAVVEFGDGCPTVTIKSIERG